MVSRVDRLPRHAAGRAGDHRPSGVQGAVRAADARWVPCAEHQLLPRAGAVRHRHQGVREYCADRIAEAIEFEGPDTVAAVFLEPVQNAGGCFPPPPGYFERVREICDEYDVLLVSDEVICAYGRIGSMFACDDFGYVPDIITCAKGLTSGYSPIGAMIASDKLFEPFNDGKTTFGHGYTFGGHPVSSAVAMANLDIFEREGLNDHVKEIRARVPLDAGEAYELPIVGDVRGEGFFYGIELVKDKATKETFNDEEVRAAAARLPDPALFEAGLYCRADDRGDPVVQLAPPLISGQKPSSTRSTNPARRARAKRAGWTRSRRRVDRQLICKP